MYDRMVIYMGFDIPEEEALDPYDLVEWVEYADIPFTSLFDVQLPTRYEFGWDRLSLLIEDSEGNLETIPLEIK